MSIARKIARGHAIIHQSDVFGMQVLIRNGRGRLQNLNGHVIKFRPNMPEGFTPAEGKPSATAKRITKAGRIYS